MVQVMRLLVRKAIGMVMWQVMRICETGYENDDGASYETL